MGEQQEVPNTLHKLLHGVLRPGSYSINIAADDGSQAGWFTARLVLLPTATTKIRILTAVGQDQQTATIEPVLVGEPQRYTLDVGNTVPGTYWRATIQALIPPSS